MNNVNTYTTSEITEEALRLKNCINGNPRYYISAVMFHRDGDFYRPKFCNKYTGKRYGAGWVFTSYSLENDIRDAIASVELREAPWATYSLTQGEFTANISDNSGHAQDGSSYWVNICIDSGDNFSGQQVIKSRSYSSIKAAQRGAVAMMTKMGAVS